MKKEIDDKGIFEEAFPKIFQESNRYKLDLEDGINRYELVKENEDHRHHHLICSKCGSVSEVEDDLLESLEKQILLKNKFLVKDHKVKFYGLCENCRE